MRKRAFTTAAIILLVIVSGSNSLFAQEELQSEELKLNLQLRPRSEFRHGLFTPIVEGQKPAAFIAQRSRMGLIYSKNQKLKVGLSAQVVTTWGNDPQVQVTANNVTLFEAWAQFYFTPQWNIKLGRQVLSYDDESILGASDWNNAGRKHDAALVSFGENKFKATLGLAYNQNSEKVTSGFYDDLFSQPYKSMQFLWMKYQFNDAIAVSALALKLDLQNRADSSVSHLETFGGNAFYKKGKWNAIASYYYQAGNKPVRNASAIKTNAWMAAAKIGYHFTKKISAGAGSDYLSGRDMNSTSSDATYFNPLFGSNHTQISQVPPGLPKVSSKK